MFFCILLQTFYVEFVFNNSIYYHSVQSFKYRVLFGTEPYGSVLKKCAFAVNKKLNIVNTLNAVNTVVLTCLRLFNKVYIS